MVSNSLVVAGLLLVGYTVIAFVTGLPQLTDFLPVGKPGDGFYKIVPSEKPDYRPWYVLGVGASLFFVGAFTKYVLNR